MAEIGPPPEDKSAKKGPAEEDAGPEQPEEDQAPAAKAQPKKAKTVKPYKTKKQKRRELEDAQENSFDSDLSESDFISGSYTKKRMEEFAAKREALKLSQDLERQKTKSAVEKPAANDDDQQPSFDPVNDSLATDDMDLGGTGNVRIGSVDSPMLKKYKKERDARGNQEKDEGEKSSAKPSAYERTASQGSTFSDMGNVFRMPVDVSPLPSPNKYDTGGGKPKNVFVNSGNDDAEASGGPEVDEREEELSSSSAKRCVVDGCDAPDYMVQRNGRCRQHNDLILQSPDRALSQEALPAPTSTSNAAQEIDEQAMEDRFKKYASDIVEEANRKINEAEQKALQASTDASTALEMAKQAQARADALESSQRASAHFEDGLKAELEAKYKAEMEQNIELKWRPRTKSTRRPSKRRRQRHLRSCRQRREKPPRGRDKTKASTLA